MRSWIGLALILASGCAQPGDETGFQFHSRDLGNHLQFDTDGSDNFAPNDLTGAASDLSTSIPPTGADLAPPGGHDLASTAADMTTTPTCAAVENCFNDLDDDCDGKINNGCPDTISVGADVPLTNYGGSGGGAVSAHCPTNQVAIGLRIFFYDGRGHISGVGVACSPVTLVRGTSMYTAQLTMPTQVASSFDGTDTDDSEDDPCDITKFQVPWTTITDTDNYVEGLIFNCGNGALSLSPTNQLSITFTDNNDQLGWDYGGGSTHSQSCGPSQAIVGYNGHDGGWLDQLQPICAPLTVNYK